jgi:sugar O-acyltransferase (sialic acid O-acetyltransferase NeuD family)
MKRYVVVGGGGFGREVISWIRQIASGEARGDVVGVLDSNPACLDGFNYGAPYLGTPQEYRHADNIELVLAVGSPVAKYALAEQLRAVGGKFATIVHPSVVIAATAKLGQGVIICPQSLVSADAHVGDFVTINACSSVGHDARIGHYSTLSAHVDVMGFAVLGEACFLGSGARVMPKVTVGNRCTVGVGAIAMRRLPDGMTLYTPPSKKM